MIASRTDVRDTPSSARELTLRGQPRPDRELAAVDERSDLAGDLPVEPQRLDRLQRHGDSSCRGERRDRPAHVAAPVHGLIW